MLTIAKLDHQLNEEIRDKELRVIGEDGAQLGIMSAAQANAMAEEQGLDLVKISPNAVPPVCKIMDYSKFCFDQKKREKEAKKNQKVVEIKEIRMSPSIDTNDFNTKVKAAQKFNLFPPEDRSSCRAARKNLYDCSECSKRSVCSTVFTGEDHVS